MREPSIFFFIIRTDSRNNNKEQIVITIPSIDLLYIFAPIETQIIMPGILEKQYVINVFFVFKGVNPAAYINMSLGTNGKLQKINKDINPVLD